MTLRIDTFSDLLEIIEINGQVDDASWEAAVEQLR